MNEETTDKSKVLQLGVPPKPKPKNGVIEEVDIFVEDHGVLTAFLTIRHEDGVQGFGGFPVYNPKFPIGVRFGGHFLMRCLQIGAVSHWDQLRGRAIRVLGDHTQITAIGHFMEDKWFYPVAEYEMLIKQAQEEEALRTEAARAEGFASAAPLVEDGAMVVGIDPQSEAAAEVPAPVGKKEKHHAKK